MFNMPIITLNSLNQQSTQTYVRIFLSSGPICKYHANRHKNPFFFIFSPSSKRNLETEHVPVIAVCNSHHIRPT
jgi:hypothetical protein